MQKDKFIRNFLMIVFGLFLSINILAQNSKPAIYNPDADAKKELAEAIRKADVEKKHVLIQIGGNWCPWCIKFHKFIHENAQIDSIIKKDYIFLLLNYSKEKPENKNLDIMKQFEFPQRFGFPVLLVLDGKGKRLHTQDSGFLESGDGYDEKKVITFLKCWTTNSISEKTYNN